jgi:cell division protease FtsH
VNPAPRKHIHFSIWYVIFALLLLWLLQQVFYQPKAAPQVEVPYSQFLQALAGGNINNVTVGNNYIYYTEEGNKTEYKAVSVNDPTLVDRLQKAGVAFSAKPPSSNLLPNLLLWGVMLLPLFLIWFFLYRRLKSGGPQRMFVGKTKAHEISGELTGVQFKDVGGVEEVEVELKEIIEFLRSPARFTRLGAKLPKGVLLVGPPGTGKTLLARATAGEAKVPFFSITGSDFVEMFVGVGAARVREMFEQAKRKAPCIVFIDEIDAIGAARASAGVLNTNDEREQTLNQLLAEMDGFEANLGVVIMAATNRPEVLDKALLRPGRFDRQVQVSLPTEAGRREILGIHTRSVSLGPSVDLNRLAQITPGFSGADLANIVNEAALLAARRDSESVSMDDFDLAIERVVAGLQRKMPLRDEVRRKVAYHEGGHALVAKLLPHTDPVHKVSIIPTAKGALGYTLQMPEEDQYLLGEEELKERMAVMLGGRAAELLTFGEPSTGAANDLEVATDLAWRMVAEFGMTASLGPVRYLMPTGSGYLERRLGLRQETSPETAALIDHEVKALVEEAQARATQLLKDHASALNEIAGILQKNEVISGEEISRIVAEEQ